MVGWTAEEMRLYPDPRVGEEGRLEQYVRGMVARRRGEDPGSAEAARVIDFYSGAGSPADVRSAIQTDALMRLPARRVALDHAARSAGGASTFAVQFDWGATGGEWRRGAFHAVDLPFTFGTLDRAGWLEFLGASPDDRGALELEARHIEAWSRFAHDGDPGWGRYPSTLMRLDGEGRGGPVPDPLGPAAELWAGLWPASGHPV
jgi:carboxylesterase type B